VLGGIALLGDRRLAAAILGMALLDLAVIFPYVIGSPPGVADGAARIEVMTFNVGISNPNRGEVAAFIEEEDPDVVFVFESSFEWEDAFRRRGLELQMVETVPANRVSGVTVLVRPSLRPLILHPGIAGETAAVQVDLGDERVAILGLHPPSPTSGERSARRDRMLADASRWVLGRQEQVIVLGDLNATPWSHAFRSLRYHAGLLDTMRGRGIQPTWPDGWGVFAIPIDHILHTPGLGSEDRHTGPAFSSAHRPVLATVGPRG
jgi:endonuclease/exonuclease/phosphatase (EEP) superfamily protein YafD